MTNPDPQDPQHRDAEDHPAQVTATFERVGEADTERVATPARAEDRQAIEALPPSSALLIVQHGPTAGARFLLDAERTTVGRHPKADIFLDDVTVSRKHAQFLFSPNGYLVRDVGSLNGTYVNRVRIDEALLVAGDEVQIGKFRLTYHPSPNRSAGEQPTPRHPHYLLAPPGLIPNHRAHVRQGVQELGPTECLIRRR